METHEKLTIKDWAVEDRPREKMERVGAKRLSTAELLAILIRTGNAGESAVDLTRKLLAKCHNSLTELGRLGIEEICQVKGIGPTKAITLLAACELGRRRQLEGELGATRITCSLDLYDYFYPIMSDLQVEECHVLYLNNSTKVLGSGIISTGGLSGTSVDIRCVLKEAIGHRATAIALCHNHPSGNMTPSVQDEALTKSMADACKTMNVTFLDHLVFTEAGYYSFADHGKLK